MYICLICALVDHSVPIQIVQKLDKMCLNMKLKSSYRTNSIIRQHLIHTSELASTFLQSSIRTKFMQMLSLSFLSFGLFVIIFGFAMLFLRQTMCVCVN